jgi:signal transduction histidine kinase
VGILLLSVAAVAYAALANGFPLGALGAVFVAAYTVHYTSAGPFDLTGATISGGAVMLGVCLLTAFPMSLLRRRERRLLDEIATRAAELERRNTDLTEMNAALEAFGFVVSHDLKEPVRGIENYLDAAIEEYGTPAGRRYVEEAHGANRRMHRLLEGLLGYSRASTMPATPRPLDVAGVIHGEACRLLYEGMLRERGASLDVDETLPPVMADEVILSQLLGNLVLNAVRHAPADKSHVRVVGAPPSGPDRVHLVVMDDGHGFPADVLARFAKLKPTRPATIKGGFGLVVAHLAAHRLGGTLWLENAKPGGGRAHVELPRAPTAPAPQA